jgi:hypothetical protein
MNIGTKEKRVKKTKDKKLSGQLSMNGVLAEITISGNS